MNNSITQMDIDIKPLGLYLSKKLITLIKNFSLKKTQVPSGQVGEFYPYLREKNHNSTNIFQE